MAKCMRVALIATVVMILPQLSQAQGVADEMNSLHGVLDQLYDEMMPLCKQLRGVGQGIAGFAATWYIAARVWRHIANAEPIDFYPLFRPFVIGFAVMFFPSVLGIINGVMKPTVTATAAMVQDSDKAITVLLKQKEDAIKQTDVWQMYVGESGSGDRDKWYKYTHPDDPTGSNEGMFESVGNDIKFAMSKMVYNFRNSVKEFMSEVLRVLYEAASLCIDTLRTFILIVLAILGPLVFGIAVFDGFQHTLTAWIARYINIFLWLPVANIFGSIIGKIQEKMLQLDISQVQATGNTMFSSTDVAYLVFMVIGIIGYFSVPSVANYIVNAGGGGALVQKATNIVTGAGVMAGVAGAAAGGMAIEAGRNLMNSPGYIAQGYRSGSTGQGFAAGMGRMAGHAENYMRDKLSGKSSGS